MPKKSYFAQCSKDGGATSKYFFTEQDAVEWLELMGGGTVKVRQTRVNGLLVDWEIVRNVEG